MEEIKKNKKSFIIFLILLIVELILLKKFTGLSFWFSISVVVFFAITTYIWPGKTLTFESKPLVMAMIAVFCFGLVNSFWKKHFPVSYEKVVVLETRMDHVLSWGMGDNTKTLAVDIWNKKRDENSRRFLDYYSKLLDMGQTKKAADTLKSFNEHWDTDVLGNHNVDAGNNHNNPGQNNDSTSVSSPGQFPSSFILLEPRKEPYAFFLKKGETSPQAIRIPINCAYEIAVPRVKPYSINYADGTVVHLNDGRNHGLPDKDIATFTLTNDGVSLLKVEIVVTRRR